MSSPPESSSFVAAERFRAIMGSFPAGVAIVSTMSAGRPVGLTTSAVASVSLEPPVLLVCVDSSSRTLPALLERRRFVVNFLHREAAAPAMVFASKSEDKFGAVRWRHTSTRLPVLEAESVAWAECVLDRDIAVGDHRVLFGLVVEGATAEGPRPPLVYHDRAFARLHPITAAS